jgi:hypothetical protein
VNESCNEWMKKLEELSNMWSKQSGDNPYIINTILKVPKCEIFNRSDFHDFYTIKSLWEGEFGVKIIFLKYLAVTLWSRNSSCIPSKHAEHERKELMRALSVHIRNLCITE